MLTTTQCVEVLKATFATEKETKIIGFTLSEVCNVVATESGKAVNIYNVIQALGILNYEILVVPKDQLKDLQTRTANLSLCKTKCGK